MHLKKQPPLSVYEDWLCVLAVLHGLAGCALSLGSSQHAPLSPSLSLLWPRFNPWSGNKDLTSHMAKKIK